MFVNWFAPNGSGHRYSLAATGIRFKDGEFGSRRLAEEAMYKFINKNGLHVEQVWDDHHFKTYLCENGVKFYINRI